MEGGGRPVNGHAVKRESKTKGVRWRAFVYIDAEHGGPRWERHGTFDLKRDAEAKVTKVLDAYHHCTYREPSNPTIVALYEKWYAASEAGWSANTRRHHRLNWKHHPKARFAVVHADWLGD
jgi:hypothetical protein